MPKARKLGRPPLPAEARKEEFIQFRVSPAMLRTVKQAAKAAGQTVPDLVRSLLQRQIGAVSSPKKRT